MLQEHEVRALLKALVEGEYVKPFQVAKRRVFRQHGIELGSSRDALLTALIYKVYKYKGVLDRVLGRVGGCEEQGLLAYALRVAAYLLVVDQTPGRERLARSFTAAAEKILREDLGVEAAERFRKTVQRLKRLKWRPASKEEELEAKYLLPYQLVVKLEKLVGSELESLVKSLDKPLAYGFRVVTTKISVEEAVKKLKKRGLKVEVSPRVPVHVRFYGGRINYDEDELVVRGYLVPQDEPSAAAGLLLDPRPGMVVVDLCAAPGGKATHLAELMRGEGAVYAFDVWPDRMERLKLLAERTGTRLVIEPVLADGRAAPKILGEEVADRVLVDPPCSSTGALAKHPDARWRLTPEKLEELVQLQRELLLAGFKLLKPGGRLLYTTCSLLPEENEENVKWLLREVGGKAKLIPLRGPYDPSPLLPETMRAWPHRHGVTGFFYALLEKVK